MTPDPLELDPDEMRRLGYRVVDLLADRWATLDDGPAWLGATRAETDAWLREPPPESPAAVEPLLEQLMTQVLPRRSQNDHPRFFAYVPAGPTWPAVLGELVARGANVFQGAWDASAGASAVELVVLDWFKQWVGYLEEAAGVLVSGGSHANLTALACARDAASLATGDAVVYSSTQAHSSVGRALGVLGFTPDQLRLLPTDAGFRLDPRLLASAIDEDVSAGRRPLAVVANGGATSTGAVDPLRAAAEVCAARGVWLHVDAAYGGFAVLTDRGKAVLDGLELADSITLDPHKWLFQPFDAGCVLVRDGAALERTFAMAADYLQDNAAASGEVNFFDRGIELTRPARALKIWLSVKSFGVGAFRDAIDGAIDLALRAEARIRDSERLELLSPAALGIVCFRRRLAGAEESELEEVNARLVDGLKASGVGMISSTRVNGRYSLRICVLNHRSTYEDVERVLSWLEDAPL